MIKLVKWHSRVFLIPTISFTWNNWDHFWKEDEDEPHNEGPYSTLEVVWLYWVLEIQLFFNF